LVVGDLGQLGRVYREADENETDETTVIDNIVSGQYDRPVKVVAFNAGEGWARDVTEDIARAVVTTARRQGTKLGRTAQDFYEWATGETTPADMVD
jgi:hypothetical protein